MWRADGLEHGDIRRMAMGCHACLTTPWFSGSWIGMRRSCSESSSTEEAGRRCEELWPSGVSEVYVAFGFQTVSSHLPRLAQANRLLPFRCDTYVIEHPLSRDPAARLFLFSDPSHDSKRLRNCFFNRDMAFASSDVQNQPDHSDSFKSLDDSDFSNGPDLTSIILPVCPEIK